MPRSINEGLASWFGGQFPIQQWIRIAKGKNLIPIEDLDDAFVSKNHKTRLQAYGEAELRILEAFDIHGSKAWENLQDALETEEPDAELLWEILDDKVNDEDLNKTAKWIIWGDENISNLRFSQKMELGIVCYVPPFKNLNDYDYIDEKTIIPGVFNMEEGGKCFQE